MNCTQNRSIRLAILAVLFVLAVPATAPAVITATGDVDPTNPNTWTGNTTAKIGYIPANDLYDGFGSVTVNGGSSLLSSNCYLGYDSDSTGEATVTGTDSSWTIGENKYLWIGYNGDGALAITGGGTVDCYSSSIGDWAGSTGEVTVDGAGSTWANGGSDYGNCLRVGNYGDGMMTITNGGTVIDFIGIMGCNSDATGMVAIDGIGSTWINNYSLQITNGTLVLANGGTVSTGGNTYVGDGDGSSGTIHFAENSGALTTGTIFFSAPQLFGTGTIHSNGIVSDENLVFDSAASLTQTLTIGGVGQDRNVTIDLNLVGTEDCLGAGYKGNGSVTIQNGVDINSKNGFIGYDPGSTGMVMVEGVGSTWTTHSYPYIGYKGHGALNIVGGGTVNNESYYCYLGYEYGATGSITVDGNGSTFNGGNCLMIGDVGNGILTITNGGTVTSGYSYLASYPYATGTVTVDGTGSTWVNNGGLYVGCNNNGTLSITHSGLVSVAGTLLIDQDDDGDSFVNMSTGGMLALAGDADDSLGDFLDLVSGSDAIRYWDYTLDGWALLTGLTPDDYYKLSSIESGDLAGYTLLTVKGMPGDANGDGQVDGSDATILASYWQAGVGDPDLINVTWSMGDFNRDGQVDGSDATILANYWQNGVEPTAAVPEPSVLVLLATVLGGFFVYARRRRPEMP